MAKLAGDAEDKTIDEVYANPVFTGMSIGGWVVLGGLLGSALVARFGPAVGLDRPRYIAAGGIIGATGYLIACVYYRRKTWREYAHVSRAVIAVTLIVLVTLVGFQGESPFVDVPPIEDAYEGLDR